MAANTPPKRAIPLIYDLSLAELKTLLVSWREKSFRTDQIWQGLYKQFWNTPDQFTTLSKSLKQKIAENLRFSALEPVRELASSDGFTIKTLFRLPDGPSIETVLMRYEQTPHPVHFHPGGLRDELQFLRHRPNGLQTPPDQR